MCDAKRVYKILPASSAYSHNGFFVIVVEELHTDTERRGRTEDDVVAMTE